jgi:hypothetical protein
MTGHLIPTAKRGFWRSFRDFLAECWVQGKWEISDYRRQWREYRTPEFNEDQRRTLARWMYFHMEGRGCQERKTL